MSPAKPPIFLLRGLTRSPFHWYSFPQVLCQQLSYSSENLIFASLPKPTTWREALKLSSPQIILDDLKRQLPQSGSVHMVGISLGALLLFHLMRQQQSRVLSLTMVNASHPDFATPKQRFSTEALLKLIKAHLICRNQGEKALLKATINNPSIRESLLSEAQEYQRNHHWSYRELTSQLLLAHRCGEHIHQATSFRPPARATRSDFSRKVLLLTGGDDRLVDPQCSNALSQHFNLKLMTRPGGGHDLTTEDPQWCAKRIKQWVLALNSPPHSSSSTLRPENL